MSSFSSSRSGSLGVFWLTLLRVFIGWHFLYEGLAKLLSPSWSSYAYLLDSQGPLSSFFESIANNPSALSIVDQLNIWGLILVGLGLILGLFTRVSSIGGIALLVLYYLSHPPYLGAVYAMPSEGNYLWIDKNLIEAAALAVVCSFSASRRIGLDRLIFKPTGQTPTKTHNI